MLKEEQDLRISVYGVQEDSFRNTKTFQVVEVNLNYLKGVLKTCKGIGEPTSKDSDFMVWSPHDHRSNDFQHDTCFNGAIQ